LAEFISQILIKNAKIEKNPTTWGEGGKLKEKGLLRLGLSKKAMARRRRPWAVRLKKSWLVFKFWRNACWACYWFVALKQRLQSRRDGGRRALRECGGGRRTAPMASRGNVPAVAEGMCRQPKSCSVFS
jgi:hypothetical protein